MRLKVSQQTWKSSNRPIRLKALPTEWNYRLSVQEMCKQWNISRSSPMICLAVRPLRHHSLSGSSFLRKPRKWGMRKSWSHPWGRTSKCLATCAQCSPLKCNKHMKKILFTKRLSTNCEWPTWSYVKIKQCWSRRWISFKTPTRSCLIRSRL